MKRIFLTISFLILLCICFMQISTQLPTVAYGVTTDAVPSLSDNLNLTQAALFEEFSSIPQLGIELINAQQRRPPSGQIGTMCVAVPQCPDCNGGGNVCRSVEQFYPGATYFLGARKDMTRRCQQANALDYCGGSRNCVRLSRQEQERHRVRYGGGCYAQCERSVACAFQGR
jgi:hypothetical protein